MIYIKTISQMFNCDLEIARKVFQNMIIDFSECTDEQFKREAEFIFFQLVSREQEKLS